jgi:HSP20 family protein
MSNPWWRRRKKKSPWFNDIYEELEKLEYLIDETIHKASEESIDKSPVRGKPVKGFSIKLGPNENSKIYYFGNRKPRQIEEDTLNDPEPLVDLIADGDSLVVLAAIPGVSKEDIDLRISENCLTVSVDTDDFDWYNEYKLPTKVNPKSAHASYKNGVLQVKMESLVKHVRNNDKISVKK